VRKIVLCFTAILVLALFAGPLVAQQVAFYSQNTIKSGDRVPVIVRFLTDVGKIDSTITRTVTLMSTGATIDKTQIKVVRGAGSISPQIVAVSDFTLSVAGYTGSKTITVEAPPNYTSVNGTLSSSQTWTKSQVYNVVGDLTVPNGVTLTIEAGTRIYLNRDINIRINGGLVLNGTESELISFLPSGQSAWGGLEFEAPQQTIDLNYTIFTGGGGDGSRIFGHSDSQPVLKVVSAVLLMNNCFLIDNEGKGMAVHDTHSTIKDCLLARCDTGAEFRYSTTMIDGFYSMFMPDEDNNIDDNDNDGLYFWSLSQSNPQRSYLNRVVIFGVEDDGIDFNRDTDAEIHNSFIANVYDKGISASMNAYLEVYGTIMAFADQGIGFKDETEVIMENCTFYKNDRAIRCFSSSIGRGEGELKTKNLIFSQSIDEDIDVSSSGIITVIYSISDTETHNGVGNLFANPGMTNPEGYDFSLTEGSPAIDSGDPNSDPDPDGSRRDMGAVPFDIRSISPICLTEINYKPLINGVEIEDLEFFELHNFGEDSYDLSGFVFTGDITLTVPANTILFPDEYILFVRDIGNWGDLDVKVVQWESGFLNNTSGNITLSNVSQEEVFSINFQSYFPWPQVTKVHNYPIELPDGIKGFEDPEKWQLSKTYGGTPGKSNVRPLVSGLVLNEFMARNESFLKDDYGQFTDWLELYNTSNKYLNLAGLYLSKDGSELSMYQFPDNNYDETTLEPGGYLLLWADNQPSRGYNHLNFTISGSGGELILSQEYNSSTRVLNEVYYADQMVDESYGRTPNGTGFWKMMDIPTPGSINLPPRDDVVFGLYINEFVARYGNSYPDEFGNYSDWIEIYNSTNLPINMGGLYLSDNESNPLAFKIPTNDIQKTTVPPKGYLVFRADALPQLGALHLNFQLSSSGEPIILSQLFNGTTFRLDEIVYEAQQLGVSYGRAPDGSDNWEFFATPTPEARNSGSGLENFLIPNNNVQIYPNPAKDSVTLKIDGLNAPLSGISILNHTGQVLTRLNPGLFHQGQENSLVIKDAIGNLNNGIYYLLIESGSQRLVKKLVVLK
jgi:hypothetical protein